MPAQNPITPYRSSDSCSDSGNYGMRDLCCPALSHPAVWSPFEVGFSRISEGKFEKFFNGFVAEIHGILGVDADACESAPAG